MIRLQEFIHKIDEGSGADFLKKVALALVVLAAFLIYDMREYRNFSSPEAMDAAQVARNLAEGHGFTTENIRPISLYLVSAKHPDHNSLKENHPDLANPPLYPLVLSCLMKVAPMNFDAGKNDVRYAPEVWVAVLNQFLMLLAIFMTFRLARSLFDAGVAWFTAAVMFGCDLLWRFSVSGLSTLLLLVIFLALVMTLVRYDNEAAQPEPKFKWLLGLALWAGILVGLGGLTRYAFLLFIIPVAGFLVVLPSTISRKITVAAVAVVACVIVVAPWCNRNYSLSGTLFGTAGYAAMQDTGNFTDNVLERTLQPDLSKNRLADLDAYMRKLAVNLAQIAQNDLPKFGGSWISAFFLVGLLFPFNKPILGRMRLFAGFALLWAVVIQAMGRTHYSTDSPELNHENLIVLFIPLAFMFGAALFYILLDQMELQFNESRYFVIVSVWVLSCLSLIFTLLPPRTYPLAYPPYYPYMQQYVGRMLETNDLMMSDMPWAIAWYGHRKCLWLTLNQKEEFFAINDNVKPINALYITQLTMDQKFQTRLMNGLDKPWGRLILESIMLGKVPTGFPLRQAWTDIFPEQLYLADLPRWKKGEKENK